MGGKFKVTDATGGGGSADLKTDNAERSNNRTLQILLITNLTNSAGDKTQQLTVPDITRCTLHRIKGRSNGVGC